MENIKIGSNALIYTIENKVPVTKFKYIKSYYKNKKKLVFIFLQKIFQVNFLFWHLDQIEGSSAQQKTIFKIYVKDLFTEI